MSLLSFLDLAVIVTYLVGITAIGSLFYRRHTTLQEYFLGGKRMTWFPVALSILAADVSVLTYLGTPAWCFVHDMRLSTTTFTYMIAIPIVIWLFLPIYSREGLYTAYQFLEARFDLRVRLLTSALFHLLRGSHIAVVIYAPALVMSVLMGLSLKPCILIMGILTAFYTALGGVRAVIWTDSIQVGTVWLGFSILLLTALHHIPGGITEMLRMGHAAGKFRIFDFSFTFSRIDNSWAILIGSTLMAVQVMSTDQAVLQKYFTTKSKKETIKSLAFYGATVIPLVFLLSFLGAVLFVFYSLRPDLKATLHNPDAVVAHYAASVLPHGLVGLIVASIFAGSMSTVSASLNSLATSSIVDFYKRLWRKGQTDAQYTLASRWATLFWGGLATLGAFFVARLGPLMIAFTKIQSLLGGIILGIFLLGAATKRATGSGAIVGSALGLVATLYVAFYTPAAFYWYVFVGCVTTVATGWCWSCLFPRPSFHP